MQVSLIQQMKSSGLQRMLSDAVTVEGLCIAMTCSGSTHCILVWIVSPPPFTLNVLNRIMTDAPHDLNKHTKKRRTLRKKKSCNKRLTTRALSGLAR